MPVLILPTVIGYKLNFLKNRCRFLQNIFSTLPTFMLNAKQFFIDNKRIAKNGYICDSSKPAISKILQSLYFAISYLTRMKRNFLYPVKRNKTFSCKKGQNIHLK